MWWIRLIFLNTPLAQLVCWLLPLEERERVNFGIWLENTVHKRLCSYSMDHSSKLWGSYSTPSVLDPSQRPRLESGALFKVVSLHLCNYKLLFEHSLALSI